MAESRTQAGNHRGFERVKRWIGQCVKIAVPIGILAWLFYRLLNDNPEDLQELLDRPQNWPRFVIAISVYLAAVTLTFYRWYLLVRSLRLPFRISDALRLGFIGFVLQFVSLGAVGGDLFKALFVAHEQPTRKPEAVATIFIDRIVGMLSLLILASSVILFTPVLETLPQYAVAGKLFLVAATIGILIFVLLLFTNLSIMPLTAPVRNFPFLRQTLLRVEGAIKLYRADRMSVVLAVGLSIITHLMQAAAIFLAATAFFPDGPGLADQIIMWAVAGSVGALPIAPGGLGTFELTYQWLYELLSPTLVVANEGFLVALLYRVMSVLSAGIGVLVYLSCRREMHSVLHEQESTAAADDNQNGY